MPTLAGTSSAPPVSPPLWHGLLRFAAALALLAMAAAAGGPALLRALAPAQQAVFHAVSPDFRLTAWQQRARGELFAEITPRRTVIIGEQVRPADPRARASAGMPLAQALLAPVLLLAGALALPGRWRVQLRRLLLALPLAALLLLVDAPLVLSGLIWELLFELMSPGETSLLVLWQQFMQGGGRIALALAGGGLVALATPAGRAQDAAMTPVAQGAPITR